MMEPNPQRPARKVGIADHLWDTFDTMAESMGSDRDALINQAMFMFARLNGFLEAGPNAAAMTSSRAGISRSPAVVSSIKGTRRDVAAISSLASPESAEKISPKIEDDPSRREVAERVLETAAELERLIKGKNASSVSNATNRQENGLEEPEAADLSSEMSEDDSRHEEAHLYLMSEGGEMDKVGKDRFVIGRGKHCDFIINSGKVSREHAVIVRDGDNYFIEDLGSSNGTWFNKQRIKRRRVEDGDEYYICSEKIKLVMR